MILIALTKSKEQQSTHGEIQSKGSFKIEANFHLNIFIIYVREIYLLYTFKIDIHSRPVKCDSSLQKQLQRGVLENVVLRNSCLLNLTAKTLIKILS